MIDDNEALLFAVFIASLAVGCNQQDKVDAPGNGAEAPAQGNGEPTGMALEGMFRYMADAALFRDCRDGKTYPVSMEGQYLELERAYLNSGIEPGSEIMASVQGRLLGASAYGR